MTVKKKYKIAYTHARDRHDRARAPPACDGSLALASQDRRARTGYSYASLRMPPKPAKTARISPPPAKLQRLTPQHNGKTRSKRLKTRIFRQKPQPAKRKTSTHKKKRTHDDFSSFLLNFAPNLKMTHSSLRNSQTHTQTTRDNSAHTNTHAPGETPPLMPTQHVTRIFMNNM